MEEAVEHKSIRPTDVRLAVGNVAPVMRKRCTPRMDEQVASEREVLDGTRLSPDWGQGVLHLPCLTLVSPCHPPAISLPALAAQPGAALTHLRKLRHERSHIARCWCGQQ